MGDFGKTGLCLVDSSGTFFYHPMMKLSIVGQKNLVSKNDSLFILTLINCWGKFICRKNLIYSWVDLIVGGKDLKIGGIGFNNLWKRNNLRWTKLLALQDFLRCLYVIL